MIDNNEVEQKNLVTVEDVYEVTVLLDFYGQLLTDRQYEVMDLHYNSDLSLGEIAEDLEISRQGVHDSIRKAKKSLLLYEKRLGLVERFREQERVIDKALCGLKSMSEKLPGLSANTEYRESVELLEKLLETL